MARMEAVLFTGLWRGTLLMAGLWGRLNNRWNWVVGDWWLICHVIERHVGHGNQWVLLSARLPRRLPTGAGARFSFEPR